MLTFTGDDFMSEREEKVIVRYDDVRRKDSPMDQVERVDFLQA